MSYQLLNCDVMEGLRQLERDSVDCIDLLVEEFGQSVGIDCKTVRTSRDNVIAQCRRYLKEGINQLILVAPYGQNSRIEVEDGVVWVVDLSANFMKTGGEI